MPLAQACDDGAARRGLLGGRDEAVLLCRRGCLGGGTAEPCQPKELRMGFALGAEDQA